MRNAIAAPKPGVAGRSLTTASQAGSRQRPERTTSWSTLTDGFSPDEVREALRFQAIKSNTQAIYFAYKADPRTLALAGVYTAKPRSLWAAVKRFFNGTSTGIALSNDLVLMPRTLDIFRRTSKDRLDVATFSLDELANPRLKIEVEEALKRAHGRFLHTGRPDTSGNFRLGRGIEAFQEAVEETRLPPGVRP